MILRYKGGNYILEKKTWKICFFFSSIYPIQSTGAVENIGNGHSEAIALIVMKLRNVRRYHCAKSIRGVIDQLLLIDRSYTFLFIPEPPLTANCSSLILCVSLVVSDDTALATLTGDCGIDLLLLLLPLFAAPLLLLTEYILLTAEMNW